MHDQVMENKNHLRSQNEELREDNSRLRTKLRQCAEAYRQVVQTNEQLVRQLDTANATVEATTSFTNRLLDQVSSLTKDLTRSPEVISEAIMSGIGTILNGYAQQAAEAQKEAQQQQSFAALGLDNMAGVEPGTFIPDVEFDEWQGPLPTPGMMTSSPVTPHPDQTPVHSITEDGRVARMDGQPMFQAGTSGRPPVGGIE